MIDKPPTPWQACAMNDAEPAIPDDLPLRAGPPPVSPPLPVALMIAALGVLGPIVFVRYAVPSPFLTAASLLLPIAGVLALVGSLASLRRRMGDGMVRARATIGPGGIVLLPRPGVAEPYSWAEIATAQATRSSLVLHLKGDGGKRTRRAIRYARLETPEALLASRIAAGLGGGRETPLS
ncbi:MAG: hypothetical protein ACYCZB_12675 [Acidiphilium sp.]